MRLAATKVAAEPSGQGGVEYLAEEGVDVHRTKGFAEVYGEEGGAVGWLKPVATAWEIGSRAVVVT